MKYDVIIIGGGPGGYHAAGLLGEAGRSCLLFEKRAIGGVCLNEGCIPTKSLLYSSKINAHASDGHRLNRKDVIARKNESVKILVGGVESSLKKKKVTVINGEAVIIGKDSEGFTVECNSERSKADKLIAASGSTPIIPPIRGLREAMAAGTALTSREILDLEEVPEKLVIIGGGVIGLEMAACYNAAGSAVSIIEMEKSIAGSLDDEISALLQQELETAGVDIILEGRVTEIIGDKLKYERSGKTEELSFSKILLSAGRKPAMISGLESTGASVGAKGVEIDDRCRTNVGGVYAIGDVTGKIMLAHVAYRQAEAAVNDILGVPDSVEYRAVPSVIYTQPEVAWAGLNEKEARVRGFDVEVRKASINMSGRHVVENGISKGICKILIDRKKGIIIGGGLIGSYASEIIYALVLMIQNKIPVASIRKTIFPHPTVCEILKETVF